MKPYDVLVIGAGPAGAATALLLARAGRSVGIVERASFPRGKVCGEFITPAALALLARLGVDMARSAGPEVRRVALWTCRARAQADMPRHTGPGPSYGRAIAREILDAELLAHALAAGAEAWQPFHARRLTGRPGAFACEIEQDGETHRLEARCVVAAHGSWEVGTLPTQPRRRVGSDGDLLGFKTCLEGAAFASDLLPLLFFPGGYAGLVHEAGGRVNLSSCVRRSALARIRERYGRVPAGEALLRHIQAENPHAGEAIATAATGFPWLACGPLRAGLRSPCTRGVFAVGNAAAEAHPLVGEGVTMALQSAVLLSRTLLEMTAGGWEEAAAIYERRWRGLFAPRVRVSAWYAALALRAGVPDAAASLLARVPSLLTLGARWSGKSGDAPAATWPGPPAL